MRSHISAYVFVHLAPKLINRLRAKPWFRPPSEPNRLDHPSASRIQSWDLHLHPIARRQVGVCRSLRIGLPRDTLQSMERGWRPRTVRSSAHRSVAAPQASQRVRQAQSATFPGRRIKPHASNANPAMIPAAAARQMTCSAGSASHSPAPTAPPPSRPRPASGDAISGAQQAAQAAPAPNSSQRNFIRSLLRQPRSQAV